MKTKLVQLVWRGESSVDPRFSSFMLPWTLADIRNHDNFTRVRILSREIVTCHISDLLI